MAGSHVVSSPQSVRVKIGYTKNRARRDLTPGTNFDLVRTLNSSRTGRDFLGRRSGKISKRTY